MQIDFLVNAGALHSSVERVTQSCWRHGSTFEPAIKQVVLWMIRKVVLAKFSQHFFTQNRVSVFTSFTAIDADLAFAIFGKDILGLR